MSNGFLGTGRGRIIAALTIIALLFGLALEGISIVTGYYNMRSAGAESEAKNAIALDTSDEAQLARVNARIRQLERELGQERR